MILGMNENKIKNNSAALEALLFVYGEPLALLKISQILKISGAELNEAADYLAEELKNSDRGLVLLKNDGRLQLGTKAEFGDLLEKIVKEETRESLTPAALETLAIISYAGPLPRAIIDYIRGVNSSFMLRNLLIRGLIERMPDPKRSNVYLYKSSFDLLKHLNRARVEELPDYQKYQELLKQVMGEESR